MTIRDDAPKIATLVDAIIALNGFSLPRTQADKEYLDSVPEDVHFQKYIDGLDVRNDLYQQLDRAIQNFDISARTVKEFIDAIHDDQTRIKDGKSPIWFELTRPDKSDTEWFQRYVLEKGNPLNERVYYGLYHPKLLQVAQARFGGTNCQFRAFGRNLLTFESDSLATEGVPSSEDWWWTREAMSAVKDGLQNMGLNFRLSDYVSWSCTGFLPVLWADDTKSAPELYMQANFAERLQHSAELERIESYKVWKTPADIYVSPLWEYLRFVPESHGEHEEVARLLGRIGEGIDTAIIISAPDSDPDDEHVHRLSSENIFRAGEAMVRLRVKLELNSRIEKGRRTEEAERKRGHRGGERSAAIRTLRITSLLDHMERLLTKNPDLSRIGMGAVARLACVDAKVENVSLWGQGSGQIEEYLGELRRGEMGEEFQRRLLSLFSGKTA